MHGAGAGSLREQLANEMRRRADTAGSEVQLAGLSLQERDQFRDRMRRHRRIDDQHVVPRGNLDDGCEIAIEPQAPFGKESRRCHGRHPHGDKGVAVGGLLQDIGEADRLDRARPVFDHDAPAFACVQLARNDAAGRVRRRSRRRWHDNANVSRRIGLAVCERSGGHRKCDEAG
jgi:hypothetical protein